jgi:S-adenosylmethionine hydrolase
MSRITLLTDFGTQDGYVGAMKGVIASILPTVIVDDVSHRVEPGDIRGAALALSRYWELYPVGTVHVVVVDPGVGTARRPIAASVDGRYLVGPDNGVLGTALEAASKVEVVELSDPRFLRSPASATFHGRDLFAPAAAYLALGLHLSRLGPAVSDAVRIREPGVQVREDALVGEVVSLDRFGNLVTNLAGADLREVTEVEVEGQRVPVVTTYGEGAPRQLVALVNSDGRVEVAARDRSAANLLAARVGTRVLVPISSRSPAISDPPR